jgi:hypothetical protein
LASAALQACMSDQTPYIISPEPGNHALVAIRATGYVMSSDCPLLIARPLTT